MKSSKVLRNVLVGAVVIGALLVPAVVAATSGIQVTGSTTVYPIVEASETPFEAAYPGYDLTFAGGGSSHGWAEIQADNCDIGMCSSKKGPGTVAKEWVIAQDAVCVLMNSAKASNLTHITTAELYEIYSDSNGDGFEQWDSLSGWTGGADANDIIPRARIEGSGTRATFLDFIGFGSDLSAEVTVISATGENRLGANADFPPAIAANPNQMGYVGLGFIDDNPSAVAVPVDDGSGAVMPSKATVNDGTYPYARNLYMYTLLPTVDPTYKVYVFDYLNWLLSPAGAQVVEDEGFVAAASVAPYWDLDGNGRCDLFDVLAVAGHWNESGSPGWITEDLDANGRVDLFDVLIVAGHWNQTWS